MYRLAKRTTIEVDRLRLRIPRRVSELSPSKRKERIESEPPAKVTAEATAAFVTQTLKPCKASTRRCKLFRRSPPPPCQRHSLQPAHWTRITLVACCISGRGMSYRGQAGSNGVSESVHDKGMGGDTESQARPRYGTEPSRAAALVASYS